MRMTSFFRAVTTGVFSGIFALLILPQLARAAEGDAAPRWWKGNLHTHSLWSDGDDYPEMIADGYKRNGYQFLGISDHNVLQEGGRWFELKQPVSIKGEVVQRGDRKSTRLNSSH